MKSFNILILGGGKKVSLAKHLINCGKKNKKKIQIYSYDLEKNPPISKIAKIIKGKRYNDKNIVSHITNVMKEKKISLVVAVTDPSTIILSKLKKLGFNSCKICSDENINKILLNKMLTSKYLNTNKKILTTSKKKGFPVIAKLNKGSASSSLFLLHSIQSKKEFEKKNKGYVFEKFINGLEYSVDLYIDQNSQCSGIVCRRRVEITGGESTKIVSEKNAKLEKLALQISDYFNIIGPANIQFIKKNDKYFFMEINPRIAGGIMNTIASGLDIPDLMIKEILNKKFKKFKFRKIKTIKYFKEHHELYN
jgi:carbamoyl-phosphate synthase large subunit